VAAFPQVIMRESPLARAPVRARELVTLRANTVECPRHWVACGKVVSLAPSGCAPRVEDRSGVVIARRTCALECAGRCGGRWPGLLHSCGPGASHKDGRIACHDKPSLCWRRLESADWLTIGAGVAPAGAAH